MSYILFTLFRDRPDRLLPDRERIKTVSESILSPIVRHTGRKLTVFFRPVGDRCVISTSPVLTDARSPTFFLTKVMGYVHEILPYS